MTEEPEFLGGEFLHEDLFTMAAAYAFHIAEAQAFLDGNKRAGFTAAMVFLRLNGFRLGDIEAALYEAMIAIAERQLTKDGFARLLRELANV